jgi:hypothetical protein
VRERHRGTGRQREMTEGRKERTEGFGELCHADAPGGDAHDRIGEESDGAGLD